MAMTDHTITAVGIPNEQVGRVLLGKWRKGRSQSVALTHPAGAPGGIAGRLAHNLGDSRAPPPGPGARFRGIL